MPTIPITRVRYTEEQGRALLVQFLFPDRFSASRAPRGIEPELVSRVIRDNVHVDSPDRTFGAVLELLRFYERADVLPHLWLALKGREASGSDVERSAYVLQAMGCLGNREQAASAGEYFDRFLTPYRFMTPGLYHILFDSLVALAPAGTPAALFRRLGTELQNLAPRPRANAAAMAEYDMIAAVWKNDAPRAHALIETKNRLVGLSAEARRPELVGIYMGLQPGGPILGTWAARQLRKEAMERSPDPAIAEFARQIDVVDESKLGAQVASAIRVRAEQAIYYLGGTLSPEQRAKVGHRVPGAQNFLWDE